MSLPSSTTIRLTHLRELWVHTGTACNLSCPFCHEGSKPGDERIAAPTLAQLAPVFQQAAELGAQRFAFTGGEPLILRGILDILLHALGIRPALVLTNGTAPFIRRAHQLAMLRAAPHPLAFRVSIDFPDEARHDAGRGLKNFRKALEGLRLLHAAGFAVGITRQVVAGEDAARVDAQFRQLLRRQRLPEDLPVVALPDLGTPGDAAPADRLEGPIVPRSPALPMCVSSRMVMAGQHGLRFHACPLTDDAGRFAAGVTLQEAIQALVTPDHRRCLQCFASGVPYGGNLPLQAV